MEFITNFLVSVYRSAYSPAFFITKMYNTRWNHCVVYIALLCLLLAMVASVFSYMQVRSYVSAEKDFVQNQIPAFMIDPAGQLSFIADSSDPKASNFITDADGRRYVVVKNKTGAPFLLINPENATVKDEILAYIRPSGQPFMFITLFNDRMMVNNGLSSTTMNYAEMGLVGQSLTSDMLIQATLKMVDIFGLPFMFLVLFISFLLKYINCLLFAALFGKIIMRLMYIKTSFKAALHMGTYALTGPMILSTVVGIIATGGQLDGYNIIGVWTISGIAIVMMSISVRNFRRNLEQIAANAAQVTGAKSGQCNIVVDPKGKFMVGEPKATPNPAATQNSPDTSTEPQVKDFANKDSHELTDNDATIMPDDRVFMLNPEDPSDRYAVNSDAFFIP